MSLHQTSTTLSRTRSLRAPAKAPTLTSTTNDPESPIPSGHSNISLFLTNLRLLDLDQSPEWPNITAQTFSAKDAAGGQKRRIQCVEWALYHLFVLWDADEAHNKLQPHFPPLDQVQSLNLRAALLRCLEQAKRSGALGRDILLRKTMLDECKGERLEEILAVFSSAVLKKLVAERNLNAAPEDRSTVAERLALENWGYSGGDQITLNGLILAHKVSLSSTLARKNQARETYRDFQELLDLKERSLARRVEQAKASSPSKAPSRITAQEDAEMRRTLRVNWTGSDAWVKELISSGSTPKKDGLLSNSFDEVWAGVHDGRLSELESQRVNLLDQLDQRVRLQRARLQKWEGFRQDLVGHQQSQREPPKPQAQKLDLRLNRHENIQPDANSALSASVAQGSVSTAYANLLGDMKAELGNIDKPKIPDFLGLANDPSQHTSTALAAAGAAFQEPISDLSEWEDEPEQEPQVLVDHKSRSTKRRDESGETRKPSISRIPNSRSTTRHSRDRSRDIVTRDRSEHRQPLSLRPRQRSKPPVEESLDDEPLQRFDNADRAFADKPADAAPASARGRFQPLQQEDDMPPPPRPISPTQAAADQILASISSTSPSPTKKPRHTLSLAERTRMSMSRTQSFEAEEDSETHRLPTVKIDRVKTASETSLPIQADAIGDEDEQDDLVARTRRSMMGFEAARQKAQLERRRSERKSKVAERKSSYFPKLEEETLVVEDSSMIAEELMEGGQDDYEAVFRSRPRIKTSPGPSPERTWHE